MRTAARFGVILLLALIPAGYLAKSWSPKTGFTSLILFGTEFQAGSLPQINALDIAWSSPFGYDGQCYAQIAIDPTLRLPGLQQALDSPSYRATRILLPALAHILGEGSPKAILDVYALLNPLFWIILSLGLTALVSPTTPKGLLCVVLILATDGTLFSIQRALTDLPAVTFLFFAIQAPPRWRALPFAAAALTREASLFGLGILFDPAVPLSDPARRRKLFLHLCIAIGPLLLWSAYVRFVVHFGGDSGAALFSWRMEGLIGAMRALHEHWVSRTYMYRAIAPVSLLVQALYLLTHPNLKSPFWRMGILFAAVFPFLQTRVFAEPEAFTRVVLPLTLAFNILLLRHKRHDYFAWLLIGNIGLLGCAWTMACTGLGVYYPLP